MQNLIKYFKLINVTEVESYVQSYCLTNENERERSGIQEESRL